MTRPIIENPDPYEVRAVKVLQMLADAERLNDRADRLAADNPAMADRLYRKALETTEAVVAVGEATATALHERTAELAQVRRAREAE